MSSDWKTVRLGDSCEKIGSGSTPKGGKESYQDEGTIRLIRSQNVLNDGFSPSGIVFIDEDQAKKLDAVSVQKGDVLLNITGESVARVCQAPEAYLPARVNQHVAIIRPKPEILDAEFLRYFLVNPVQQDLMLGLASAGATRSALTKGMIEEFRITCPAVEIQRLVARFLGMLDDQITLLRETNETLEAIAQAIFKSWFVDFDPVKAKAEGRIPVGIDSETAALFPDSFEESPLGAIPKGWSVTTVGATFDLTMGQSPPGDTYNINGSGYPFFQGRTDFGFRFPTDRMFCTAPTRFAKSGDVLVSVRAPVGDVNVAHTDCCIGRGLAAVRFPQAQSYALYACKSLRHYFDQFEGEGTVFGSINKKQFEDLPLVFGDPAILSSFQATVGELDALIRVNSEEIKTLSDLRDTLLPRLISGKLKLPESEQTAQSL